MEGVVLSLTPYRVSRPESMKSRRQDTFLPAFHSRLKLPDPIQALESIQDRKAVPRTNSQLPNPQKCQNLEKKVMGNARKSYINININIQHPTFTKINKQGRLALAEGGSSSRNIRPKTGQG
jgi:hypothetical protein